MKQENGIYRLNALTDDGDCRVAEVELLKECPVYQGHFPGMPITPGVMLLAITRELVDGMIGQRCSLSKVRNVKFLQILTPNLSPVRFRFSELKSDEAGVSVRLSIENDVTVFAKLSLEYNFI